MLECKWTDCINEEKLKDMCYIFYRAETDANVFDFVRRYTADYTVVSRRFVKFSIIFC
jgi:hypothetical protein